MDLQFPVARESAPDRRKRCTSNALATALRHDVELGDLPGATSGCRAANQDKTNDGPWRRMTNGWRPGSEKYSSKYGYSCRVGRTDGSLSVIGQFAEIVVEQTGDRFAILQSCVKQIHN
jgi:hypothetical protein